MTINGITKDEEEIIFKILSPYFEKYDFYFYGSRCRTDFRPLSDLDILVKGAHPLDLDDLDFIKSAFDESNLPYIVNITDYHSITPEFYKSIEDDIVKFS